MPTGKNSDLFHLIHFSITLFCFAGFAISFSSFFLEIKAEKTPKYVALCDISEQISCTRAFTSPYGKGFGLIGKLLGEKPYWNFPNCVYTMGFYTLFIFLNAINYEWATRTMVLLGVASSALTLYLVCALLYTLQTFCLISVITSFINASLLFSMVYKGRLRSSVGRSDKKQKLS